MATIRQSQATYALTISTYQQHRHFQKTTNAELFIQTLFHYRDTGKFLLHAFAVMPDHVHILLTPAIDVSTAKAVQFIKGGYSHALKQQASGGVWHTGHFEHRVRDALDFEAQSNYIASNPAPDNPHVHTNYADRLDLTKAAPRSAPEF